MYFFLLLLAVAETSAFTISRKIDVDARRTDEFQRIVEAINNWSPEHGTHIWEHSGRFEGDIDVPLTRNGLVNASTRWPDGIVPFEIDPLSFSSAEVHTIKLAIDEFHTKACLKFRPKRKSDKNYVLFLATGSGCWSSVGMQGGAQKLNLQAPNCVRVGTVIHELLHAVGFYHQQSAANRDDYVKINWENICERHKHNFNKYNDTVVTDFGVGYDYKSVMHYSGLAFSKNQLPTIEALTKGNVTLGQRTGFSETDLEKLSKMYGSICDERKEEENGEEGEEEWFSMLNWNVIE